jgi:hypothetical protein
MFPLLPIQTGVRGFSIKSMKSVLSAGAHVYKFEHGSIRIDQARERHSFKGTAARDARGEIWHVFVEN